MRVACAVPLPAKVRKFATGRVVVAVNGLKTWIASLGLNAPESRHPAVPSTPLGQPAKVMSVPEATSAFQGGPAGVELVSGLKLTLLRVTVTVPPDPVFRSPMIVADAI